MAAFLDPSYDRFLGPVLSSLTENALFAGRESTARMTALRDRIADVRKDWRDTSIYRDHVSKVKQSLYQNRPAHKDLREQIERILAGYHDWADFPANRDGPVNLEPWALIELYSSNEGYDYLFRFFNEVVRSPTADQDKLLAAAFLTELLAIELYNFRLSNIGDPLYENYQGIVYRGLGVSKQQADDFRKAATNPVLTERMFSVPLGLMSSSTAKTTMDHFANLDSSKDPMCWIIHVHGLERELLHRYHERFPESVVTSLCAMPIVKVAHFAEKEVLLWRPWFQILRMETQIQDGRAIHLVEMVMLNTNRDHGSELSSNEGIKYTQRRYFNEMILASRSNLCSMLTKAYSLKDSAEYARISHEALHNVEEYEKTLQPSIKSNIPIENDHVLNKPWSSTMTTWVGDMSGHSFPQKYRSNRLLLQRAARNGAWVEVCNILRIEYESRQADWFNVAELHDEQSPVNNGRTLLHELAIQGPPSRVDAPREFVAWQEILSILSRSTVWKSIRCSGDTKHTAAELALLHGNEDMLPLLKPNLRRQIPDDVLENLERQLHAHILNEVGIDELDRMKFRMPELGMLRELESPELWIPISGIYGGFLVKLRSHQQTFGLLATLFRIPRKIPIQRLDIQIDRT